MPLRTLTTTLSTPEPPVSLVEPQMSPVEGVLQPAFQVVALYDPLVGNEIVDGPGAAMS